VKDSVGGRSQNERNSANQSAFARAFRAFVFVTSRVRRRASRALGVLALANAIVLVWLGGAQALTPTTTTVAGSPDPSTVGQSVTLTATISGSGGTPTGTVTFRDNNTSQTLGTITLSGGVATVTTSTLAIGNHTIQASYSGERQRQAR
jgi:hypothetical protein